MKRYLVTLMNVELSMIMACKSVTSKFDVRNEFNKFALEYCDDWSDLSIEDKDCYFDCFGYNDSGYVVQWVEMTDDNFDNDVKL